MLFHAVMEFCLDLLRSKFWLIGEWSNGIIISLEILRNFFNDLSLCIVAVTFSKNVLQFLGTHSKALCHGIFLIYFR